MSLTNRKNQISFLQVRTKQDPGVSQTSDNVADAFKQVNNVLLQFDRRTTLISGSLRTLSGSASVTSGTLASISSSYTALSASFVEGSPILSGSLIGPTTLDGGMITTVAHGLGRVPNGYFIADLTSGSTVFRTGWDATNLSLSSSVTTGVKLWIF